MEIAQIINKLHINYNIHNQKKDLIVKSPINGENIAELEFDSITSYNDKIKNLETQYSTWHKIPAPKRGEFIRLFAQELRNNKEDLAQLVTLESGKILAEGRGEVQEMIDICDFAVGLSRQLYGLTIASERTNHNMYETYYPLGIVGIISAFNFPVAVWAWNFALAAICGNVAIWKPSEKTPLCAIACHNLLKSAAKKFDSIDDASLIHDLVISDTKLSKIMVKDHRIPLISATGSCQMGQKIAPIIANRFGKSILELGGNNAVIVTNNVSQELALKSILFGAVGTCGQRCTTTRRAFIHKSIYEEFSNKLISSYKNLDKIIGNPLNKKNLIGPLISKESYQAMQNALSEARKQEAKVFFGDRILKSKYPNSYYVKPAIVKANTQIPIILEETFAPILYLIPYHDLNEAMKMHNAVSQGLSSSIFTNNIIEAEYFRKTSDCGIANVNIGTSGAEIGGAFGGEKSTGGGRESGSDSWKNYMRRQTSTVYHGTEIPELAQNIKFDIITK